MAEESFLPYLIGKQYKEKLRTQEGTLDLVEFPDGAPVWPTSSRPFPLPNVQL